MVMVACPTCETKHEYNTNSPYRPFCSERCKLIDLGAWSQESYKIPVKPTSEDLPIDEDF